MRTIVGIIGVLAVLAGLYFVVNAWLLPNTYRLTDASAIQMTQLYTMATYQAVLGIACFVFAGLCAVSARFMAEEDREFRKQAEAQGLQVTR